MQKVLSQESIENNRTLFISLLRRTQREGIEDLIEWLMTTDFFYAPSSSKYQGDFEGGLCLHSLNVCRAALRVRESFNGVQTNGKSVSDINEDSIILCSLLHDVCKVNTYQPETKFTKGEDGSWKSYITYSLLTTMPVPHSVKSIIYLTQFIHLSVEEYVAIYWHMSQTLPNVYLDSSRESNDMLNAALQMYPLTLLISHANAMALYTLDRVADQKALAE